jgi:hypothetical protein
MRNLMFKSRRSAGYRSPSVAVMRRQRRETLITIAVIAAVVATKMMGWW